MQTPSFPSRRRSTSPGQPAALALCAGTLTPILCAVVVAVLGGGCGASTSGAGEDEQSPTSDAADVLTVGADGVERDDFGIPVDAPVSARARETIGAFVEAMIPPPDTYTSDHHDRWFHETRRLLGELMAADEEIGHAALHAFTGEVSERTVTRRALLMIGARCSPREAATVLRELMLNFGYRYDDRAEATLLLAEADPEGYLVDAEQYLRRRERPTKTMPPDEFLMRGWITACTRSGNSPVDMCADVATNLAMEPMARYIATEELGRHPDNPLARSALETCLIESTGDGNLRRKAAQAIELSYSSEDACALFKDVLSKEADGNFAAFLFDMLQRLGCR